MSELKVDNKVKILRVTNGDLTQQALADKVGCSRQTIHSIESGKFVPSVELALKLALVLNSKVEDLFQLKEQL
jgi:putative transcriptional regulator